MKLITRMIAVGLAMAVVAVPSNAATWIFSLSTADASANLVAGPYGTVSVTESNGSLIFTETLASGIRIHDGNATHNAFDFSLTGAPAVTVTNLTSGFQLVSGGVNAPPFGSFNYGIDCTTACGPGYQGGYAGTLSFTVALTSGGSLSLASLASTTVGNTPIYFASDIVGSNGNTANVGATLSSTPEPASWAMLVAGFGVMGAALRRRRRDATYALR